MSSIGFEFTDSLCNCSLHVTPQYYIWSDNSNIEDLIMHICHDLNNHSFAHIENLTNAITRSLNDCKRQNIDKVSLTQENENRLVVETGILFLKKFKLIV